MPQMSSKRSLISLFVVIGLLVLSACDTAKNFMQNDATKNLARKAGVSDQTMKTTETAVQAGEKLSESFQNFQNAFTTMSIEDERSLGESVMLQAYASKIGPPIRHPELMKFINTMVNAIAVHGDRPMISYHVAIVDSDDFNAFAAPGGFIFLTKGLIMDLDNEAELAVVLGHELGHVAKRHAVEDLQNGQAWQGFINLIAAGTEVTGAMFNNNFDVFEDLVKEMSQSLATSYNQYDTSIELEADKAGVDYALSTGYDPRAMLTVFNKLKAYYPKNSDTHPSLEEREKQIQDYLSQKSSEEMSDLVTSTGRLQQVKAWIQQNQGWQ